MDDNRDLVMTYDDRSIPLKWLCGYGGGIWIGPDGMETIRTIDQKIRAGAEISFEIVSYITIPISR
jgi:hypothetical protein